MALYKVTMEVKHYFVQYTDVTVEVEAQDEKDAYYKARTHDDVKDSRDDWDTTHEDTEIESYKAELLLGEEGEEIIPRLPSKFLTSQPIMIHAGIQ